MHRPVVGSSWHRDCAATDVRDTSSGMFDIQPVSRSATAIDFLIVSLFLYGVTDAPNGESAQRRRGSKCSLCGVAASGLTQYLSSCSQCAFVRPDATKEQAVGGASGAGQAMKLLSATPMHLQ